MDKLQSASRIISGSFGTLHYNGVKIAECSGTQAKVQIQREDQQIPGSMLIDSKATGTKGTGSSTIKHVFSAFADYLAAVQRGEDPRAVLISTVDDPDAYGAERVALYNVVFDDVTLADWSTGKTTDRTVPFRFTHAEYLQEIPRR